MVAVGTVDVAKAREADAALGIKTSSAEVDFAGDGNSRINVSIKDASALSGLAGLAEMVNSQTSEQGGSYERSENLSGHNLHEKWDASSRHGELSLIVAKRFGVDVTGDNVDMDALKRTLAQVDCFAARQDDRYSGYTGSYPPGQ